MYAGCAWEKRATATSLCSSLVAALVRSMRSALLDGEIPYMQKIWTGSAISTVGFTRASLTSVERVLCRQLQSAGRSEERTCRFCQSVSSFQQSCTGHVNGVLQPSLGMKVHCASITKKPLATSTC